MRPIDGGLLLERSAMDLLLPHAESGLRNSSSDGDGALRSALSFVGFLIP